MTIYLIRHGRTKGNLEGRYIGSNTDESLCEEGIAELCILEGISRDAVVYVSPMKRAMETAACILPENPKKTIDNFREMNFGQFENKNYNELNGNPDYQRWIDGGGTTAFPDGEEPEAFRTRTTRAFLCLLREVLREEDEKNDKKEFAIVAHGGTVMSIMHALTTGEYYDFQVKNGDGYRMELEIDLRNKDLETTNFEDITVVSYDCISCRISA